MSANSYAGRLFDGRSAAAIAVTAVPEDGGLRLVGDEGRWAVRWSYPDLRLIDRGGDGRPLRLANQRLAAARLSSDDPALIEALIVRAPDLGRRKIARTPAQRRLAVVGVACLVGVLSLVIMLPMAVSSMAELVPPSWAEALGDAVMAEVRSLGPTCRSRRGRAALDRLRFRLTDGIEMPHEAVVEVVENKMVNALAAPGGRIVLFSGLIDHAESPDEVAGVLAHELGHVVHRHPMQGMLRRLGFSLIVNSLTGNPLNLSFMLELSHGREAERLADVAAVEILSEAGLRADGLARFFERLASEAGGAGDFDQISALLSTHPPTAEREALVREAARAGGRTAMSPGEWQTLKAICSD